MGKFFVSFFLLFALVFPKTEAQNGFERPPRRNTPLSENEQFRQNELEVTQFLAHLENFKKAVSEKNQSATYETGTNILSALRREIGQQDLKISQIKDKIKKKESEIEAANREAALSGGNDQTASTVSVDTKNALERAKQRLEKRQTIKSRLQAVLNDLQRSEIKSNAAAENEKKSALLDEVAQMLREEYTISRLEATDKF
jgi:hypothetical protein